MFERILVPLDGSERAERALPVVARLVHASGGTITLLRIVTGAIDAEQERAADYLARIATSPELAGINVQTDVRSGFPAQTILAAAREQQVNLIILGSHGETGFQRWVLGSVAQQVTRHSPTPVLVLHQRGGVPTRLSPADTQPMRILVALDGSSLAESVLAPAAYLSAALSAPQPGALHLALVLPSRHLTDNIFPAVRKQAEVQARAYLDLVTHRLSKDELAPLDLQVTSSVAIQGDVAETLIGMAETGAFLESGETFHGCYILALATHGRSGVERWARGSVTERILGATILPLLIVRPRKGDSREDEAKKSMKACETA